MKREFRIAPKDKLTIEWRVVREGARWGFFKICDSSDHAKTVLATLQGKPIKSEEDADE